MEVTNNVRRKQLHQQRHRTFNSEGMGGGGGGRLVERDTDRQTDRELHSSQRT